MEEVWAKGESLMCQGDGATRSKIEVHEGCLKQGKCTGCALNKVSHKRISDRESTINRSSTLV